MMLDVLLRIWVAGAAGLQEEQCRRSRGDSVSRFGELRPVECTR